MDEEERTEAPIIRSLKLPSKVSGTP